MCYVLSLRKDFTSIQFHNIKKYKHSLNIVDRGEEKTYFFTHLKITKRKYQYIYYMKTSTKKESKVCCNLSLYIRLVTINIENNSNLETLFRKRKD